MGGVSLEYSTFSESWTPAVNGSLHSDRSVSKLASPPRQSPRSAPIHRSVLQGNQIQRRQNMSNYVQWSYSKLDKVGNTRIKCLSKFPAAKKSGSDFCQFNFFESLWRQYYQLYSRFSRALCPSYSHWLITSSP